MDEHEDAPPRYYDRHVADWSPPQPASSGPGCLVALDGIGLFGPIWLALVLMAILPPIYAAVSGNYRGALIFIAFYGGIAAAYVMVPWGGAYLLARVVSLAIGGAPLVALGFAGIGVAVLLVVSGVLGWSSMLIAVPSLSVMISGAVRAHATH